ncbi:glycosyltransferase, partial [bacterium]|nr:glycosyltransferase [bacterium]
MRIIHLIPYFPPANCFGGTPEAVYALARAQAQLGHEVYVITSDAGLQKGGEPPELQLEWIESRLIRAIGCNPEMKIVYARNRRPALAEKKIFTASFWNREIEKWLPGSTDILHFHEVHILGYRAIFQSLVPRKNINAFMSAHGSLKPPTHAKIRGFVHKLTDPILRAGWFDKLQGYFALSRAEQKQYLSCGIDPSRIHILPHGKPEFPPSPLPLPFTIPAMQEGPTFLFVGRLNSAKGILT